MAYVLRNSYADIYESFLDYQKPRLIGQGVRSLKSLVYLILKWFDEEDLDVHTITVQEALRYRESLCEAAKENGAPLSSGCVANYLGQARTLFSFLVDSGIRQSNPFEGLTAPRRSEHLCTNYVTELQMYRLLETLGRFDEATGKALQRRRYRVHVLSEVLYATGLRISELESIREADINLRERIVYVQNGKGGKPRSAFLTGYAAEVLDLYLRRGRYAALSGYERTRPDCIFGGRLGPVLRRELEDLCPQIELPVITCHGFRHSLGTHLLRAGCDMRHIQVILGHDSIASTQVYTHVDKEDLKRSLDACHPRQWNRTP